MKKDAWENVYLVLIDWIGSLKLADFGLGRHFQMPMRMYTHEVLIWIIIVCLVRLNESLGCDTLVSFTGDFTWC